MQTVATPDDQLWEDNNGQGQRAAMGLGRIKNAEHFDFQNGRRQAIVVDESTGCAWGCAQNVVGNGAKAAVLMGHRMVDSVSRPYSFRLVNFRQPYDVILPSAW